MAGHKAKDETHDEDDGVQAIRGEQRGLRAAVRHNRTGNDKRQHGADGPAGQYEVNQFWRGHSGLL